MISILLGYFTCFALCDKYCISGDENPKCPEGTQRVQITDIKYETFRRDDAPEIYFIGVMNTADTTTQFNFDIEALERSNNPTFIGEHIIGQFVFFSGTCPDNFETITFKNMDVKGTFVSKKIVLENCTGDFNTFEADDIITNADMLSSEFNAKQTLTITGGKLPDSKSSKTLIAEKLILSEDFEGAYVNQRGDYTHTKNISLTLNNKTFIATRDSSFHSIDVAPKGDFIFGGIYRRRDAIANINMTAGKSLTIRGNYGTYYPEINIRQLPSAASKSTLEETDSTSDSSSDSIKFSFKLEREGLSDNYRYPPINFLSTDGIPVSLDISDEDFLEIDNVDTLTSDDVVIGNLQILSRAEINALDSGFSVDGHTIPVTIKKITTNSSLTVGIDRNAKNPTAFPPLYCTNYPTASIKFDDSISNAPKDYVVNAYVFDAEQLQNTQGNVKAYNQEGEELNVSPGPNGGDPNDDPDSLPPGAIAGIVIAVIVVIAVVVVCVVLFLRKRNGKSGNNESDQQKP